jgi:hypothetical protein
MPLIKSIKPFVSTFFSERIVADNAGPDGGAMTPANEKGPFNLSTGFGMTSTPQHVIGDTPTEEKLIDFGSTTTPHVERSGYELDSERQSQMDGSQKQDTAGNRFTTREGVNNGYQGGLGLIFKYPGDPRKLREKSKMKLWRDYFRQNGKNLTLLRYPSFNRLVQVGLPSRLRGEIWEITSGSGFSRLQNPGEYARILQECEGKKTLATDEIEKDLNRSLPEYPAYQDKEGISTLRRVLTAYAWKNPVCDCPNYLTNSHTLIRRTQELGYCQAMNIVVAAFLM